MLVEWHIDAWREYVGWLGRDRQVVRRINKLVEELVRNDPKQKPIGQGERLKGSRHGLCSVRIDHANRLVYKLTDGSLLIVSCKGHYLQDEDKLDL